jgi:SAM-dependent methyltransferase
MEHRGMVHALQEIRRLLKPRGILIDIHPVPVAPLYTYGSTVKELLDFLEESSAFHQAEGTEDEPLSSEEEAFFDRLEESHRSAGAGAEVAVRERGRASRLRPAR